MDRHRFDADPFDVKPNPDPDLTPSLTHVRNVSSASLHNAVLEKVNFTFSLHWFEIDTDPGLDLQVLDADPTRSGSAIPLEPLPSL